MLSKYRMLTLSAALAASVSAHAQDRHVVLMQALTGPGSFAGVGVIEGLKFGIDELNANKFLGNDKINYVVVDDASDRGQATSGVARFAADPKYLMVVGPTIAPTAIASAAVANERQFTIFSLTNATAALQPGPWSFISSQPGLVTMPLLGDYALNKAKVRNCAMVSFADNDAYVQLAKVFREYVEPKGLKIVDYTGIKQTDSDFSAIATRIVNLKPDCVLTFVSHVPAANLAIQLREAGLDPKVQLIGHSALSNADLVKIGGKAVEGVVFTADWLPGGATDFAKKFADNMRKHINREPDNWHAMGYTLAQVVGNALKNAGPNPTRQAVRDALAKTDKVVGAMGDGTYTIDADRIPRYGVVFLTVKDGKFVRLEQ